MKFRFYITAFIFFIAQVVADDSSSAIKTKYSKWYNDHSSEIEESLNTYLSTQYIAPFEEGLFSVYLSDMPHETHFINPNKYASLLGCTLIQGEVKLYGLLLISQQIQPFKAEPQLLYTTDNAQYMPSFQLYCDVMGHLYVRTKQFPECHVHIDTVHVDGNGCYAQEWLFYNDKKCNNLTILFIPSADGGTDFAITLTKENKQF